MTNPYINTSKTIQWVLLVLLIGGLTACRPGEKPAPPKPALVMHAKAISLQYEGEENFRQGNAISINGIVFYHDSLFLFRKPWSAPGDTVYLPTKKYVSFKDNDNSTRALYQQAAALDVLRYIAVTTNEIAKKEGRRFAADNSRLLTQGLIVIHSTDASPLSVTYSKNYPLNLSVASIN